MNNAFRGYFKNIFALNDECHKILLWGRDGGMGCHEHFLLVDTVNSSAGRSGPATIHYSLHTRCTRMDASLLAHAEPQKVTAKIYFLRNIAPYSGAPQVPMASRLPNSTTASILSRPWGDQ